MQVIVFFKPFPHYVQNFTNNNMAKWQGYRDRSLDNLFDLEGLALTSYIPIVHCKHTHFKEIILL